MTTVALNLALQGKETHWEHCPACGLMFEAETQTKKIAKEKPMQVTFTIDVTPQNAPLLAQLLVGGGSTSTRYAAVVPGSTAQATQALTPEPIGAPAPEDASPQSPTDLKTLIREKTVSLKKAGKGDIVREAMNAMGYDALSKVPEDKYAALWEVLKDAG